MFEAAELGQSLSVKEYEASLPKLRANLLQAQLELRERKFPVIVCVSGADGAGKGELVQRLNEWLDPRGVETHAFWGATDEERERPRYWRFWRTLPARGRIGILFGSWYTEPIVRRALRKLKRSAFDTELEHIVAFEQMLADDGALFVKFWLHLSKREQKKRLKKLEKAGRLGPDDWKHFKHFEEFAEVSERALRQTNTGAAPWHLIEATDRRYRELTAGEILLKSLRARLAQPAPATAAKSTAEKPATGLASRRAHVVSVLDRVDLKQKLSRPDYEALLDAQQAKLGRLAWAAQRQGISSVLLFEGWDAAGKGSAIRRVTQAMDPRLYRVVGIAAPNDEERAHHYLWRFWRQLPGAGFTTLFDRSWYGRVLVERVEGFASPAEWGRAYQEINAFEEQLTDHGMLLNKFWIHLSPQEQLRRFHERQTVAYKRHKITDEDWRNREKWDDYKIAVNDMIANCSTEYAPWTLVAGNDKKFARIQILKTITERLEAAL
ncbi:polyphosphate:AMP phosphotransferase [Opitutus terrae]|uniref:Polyphosphate kinase-2-related domain-containing protein n=1 Tax=Opitutus terrae (strain DSM 11246 / JCM 15787 / PB90-1) TaxID=452637 RepID=B1ZN06_OPITP|nr:polyphosphate:AMP phosphotransferase [Opitutus terrae]ACB76458.1 protein of unknown function DUF344 [Opitutus terrae PB90-1]